MSHPELIEHADRLEVRSPMRAGMRVLLAALALVPLLAPYELLIRVGWEDYLHPSFFLAAFVSAGAVALSAILVFAAVAALSSRMVFDKGAAEFRYSVEALVLRQAKRIHPLAEVRAVEVGVREWSDGAPSYHLRVCMADGAVYESGASWSRDEVQSAQARVERFRLGTD